MDDPKLTLSLSPQPRSPKVGDTVHLGKKTKQLKKSRKNVEKPTKIIYSVLAIVSFLLYIALNSSMTNDYVSKYLTKRGSIFGLVARGSIIAFFIILISYSYEYLK